MFFLARSVGNPHQVGMVEVDFACGKEIPVIPNSSLTILSWRISGQENFLQDSQLSQVMDDHKRYRASRMFSAFDENCLITLIRQSEDHERKYGPSVFNEDWRKNCIHEVLNKSWSSR